jgi:cobyrinic acid a,c-diamide synthase
MSQIPRLVIAGTHSGCGKTTVATGVMAALVARGLQVQPFKVGPDFIDPTHHTKICGRVSRNLDPFMMGEDGVCDTFQRASRGADIAVIEGVMGLFDGIDGSDRSSTAHVATIVDAPVVLVVDAKGMSRSAHALIHGFSTYQPYPRIAGIIFNMVGSDRHRQMIESSMTVPAFGWIPKKEELMMKSRHLGLEMAHETSTRPELGTIINEHCDIGALIDIARTAPPQLPAYTWKTTVKSRHAKIGIAWDPAFCFYYQDNLDRLRSAGAELVFFSPLHDRVPDVDGIYLGGGYPELHLAALSASGCRTDIARLAEAGIPVYAECGGLMYLTKEISADRTYRLCGVLPASIEMTKKIQALGYVQGTINTRFPCFPVGLSMVGHEFHYSRVIPEPGARYAISLARGRGIENGKDGLFTGSVIGTYMHAYFSFDFCRHFVQCCATFRGSDKAPE